MKMCIGFGERRGHCTNEAIYFTDDTGIGWCGQCKAELDRRDIAATQATAQREYDMQNGLVTVWE